MKNTECDIIKLRQYTPGEKIANVSSHLLGALIAIYGIIMLWMNSKKALQLISSTVFGLTLFFLFLSSACYHFVTNENSIRFFQKIDHAAIYLLIAGTYTPALLITVKFPLSIIVLVGIWGLAISGIIFYCVMLKSKYLSTGLYLLMGWLSLFFVYNVWTASHLAVWLLLAGGIFYSVGSVFYLIKAPYTHFVWHLFVIAGAVFQYFAIIELLKVTN